jgi:hypothetical protein
MTSQRKTRIKKDLRLVLRERKRKDWFRFLFVNGYNFERLNPEE